MTKKQNNIANRIRFAREQAGLDPSALRGALRDHGVELSKTGLHRLETTEPEKPNLKAIEAIAELTHVSPGWILFGTGPAVPGDEVGAAIRSRVIDTIELMAGALDMTGRQQTTFENWLSSMRKTTPKIVSKP